MFDHSVFRFGDRPCQCWKTGEGSIASLTYAQVGRIVREVSAGLMSLDLQRQDRVAIMSANSPQWLWADFAILNAGLVTVALYPTLSQREMAAMINDSGSKALFVQNRENLQKVFHLWDEMPTLEKVIVMEDDFSGDKLHVISLKQLREEGARFLARHPFAHDRWRSVNLFDPMTIIYTSGTTGEQKGAVHTHYSMNAAGGLVLKSMPAISEEDVFLSILPLSHSYERQCGQMTALTVGSAIAYSDKPAAFLEDLRIFEPTIFMATPRYFEMIFNAIQDLFASSPQDMAAFEQALEIGLQVIESRSDEHGFVDMSEGIDFTTHLGPDLKHQFLRTDAEIFMQARALLGKRYRFAFSAAGGLPARLCRILMAMGIRVIEGYGLIETCNTINLNRLSRIMPGSVGPLAVGVEGRTSEDGELLVRGDNVIKEYWNNPGATAEAFTEEGFFRTGDIVEEVAEGYMRIIDRKKGLLILNSGENIPAAKLESAFFLNPYIDQICVLGDDRPFVAALVVPRFDLFAARFREEGVRFDETALQYETGDGEGALIKVGPDFIAHKSLRALIDREIEKVNRTFEDYEAIRKYIIINRKFAAIADEVTPTLKLKRKVIYGNFADEIDKLYQEGISR
jgi:long-chain acyl-CoA synthetase